MPSTLKNAVAGKVLDYYAPIEYCPPPVIKKENIKLPDLSQVHYPKFNIAPTNFAESEDCSEDADFPDIDIVTNSLDSDEDRGGEDQLNDYSTPNSMKIDISNLLFPI